MQPCLEPVFTGTTNGDLAQYALDLRGVIRLCNADKAALREWSNSINHIKE